MLTSTLWQAGNGTPTGTGLLWLFSVFSCDGMTQLSAVPSVHLSLGREGRSTVTINVSLKAGRQTEAIWSDIHWVIESKELSRREEKCMEQEAEINKIRLPNNTARTHAHTRARTHTHVHTYAHILHVRARARARAHTHTHTRTYTHTRVRACTRARMLHTRSLSSPSPPPPTRPSLKCVRILTQAVSFLLYLVYNRLFFGMAS